MGFESAIDAIPQLSGQAYPWWGNEIRNADIVTIGDVDSLPGEASAEKEILKQHKIKSMTSVTVRNKGKILGILLFMSVREARDLGKNHEELLMILANLLSDALIKVEFEKEIRNMAYYDDLTKLPNHTLFKNRLDQMIHLSARTQKLIGVIFIDLDSFKSVNDSLGHLGGDTLLIQVAGRLSKCLRKSDTVSRFGGDEFLIMLGETNQLDDITRTADKNAQIHFTAHHDQGTGYCLSLQVWESPFILSMVKTRKN